MTEPKRPAKKTTARAAAPTKKAVAKKASPRKKPAARKTAAAARKKPAPPKDDPKASQVLELRRAGVALDVIAQQLGYTTVDAAHDALVAALDATLPPTPDEAKRLELDRLDRLQVPLWSKALRGDLAAVDRIARLITERQKVVSTDPLPPTDERGPIEAATAIECERLKANAPALAAAALVLARIVDESKDDANAASTAARELRITMSQLRGLAGTAPTGQQGGTAPTPDGPGPDKPPKKPATVSWLDELRERSEARRGSA